MLVQYDKALHDHLYDATSLHKDPSLNSTHYQRGTEEEEMIMMRII